MTTTTEAYAAWLENYRVTAKAGQVEGWLNANLFPSLVWLHEIQQTLGARGGIMEIGVHHGLFFMTLNAMVEAGEGTSYAVDLFDQQEMNIDKSGKGHMASLEANLALHDRHKGANVERLAADSTRIAPQDRARLAAARPKVISIDGGHTAEHTISDLRLAAEIVHPLGAVFVDDILNPNWPGVIEGVVLYLNERPTLWPVMVGFNKMILVPMSVHPQVFKMFQERIPKYKRVSIAGYSLLSNRM